MSAPGLPDPTVIAVASIVVGSVAVAGGVILLVTAQRPEMRLAAAAGRILPFLPALFPPKKE